MNVLTHFWSWSFLSRIESDINSINPFCLLASVAVVRFISGNLERQHQSCVGIRADHTATLKCQEACVSVEHVFLISDDVAWSFYDLIE